MMVKRFSDEKFLAMAEFYKQQTDFDNMLIVHYFKDEVIKNEEQKNQLHSEIEKLFNIDGDYSEDEQNLMLALKTIMD